ncbi:RNA dependent RNA polymerase [Magnaporthe oryzae chrysovirus 1-B]|uniref:RNA-directed RNA polymerase n=1 Tax=Magnaporthe oryzae chrysovirus 1 TaxID=764348 RepID=V5YU68_9VIRU|nr:RNA dependent RNA polymerase [Magnaporthe oryzae chrysovirus 1]BAO20927.1 RNA dependent RNA polymerase [Magnaporthe oryzae chrysovirus 1-B]
MAGGYDEDVGSLGSGEPVFGASYTNIWHSTLLAAEGSVAHSGPALYAIVLPLSCGKSSLASVLSGYDIDDMVVNSAALHADDEWRTMLDARSKGWAYEDKAAYRLANDLMLRRARRFLRAFEGDDNAPVVYVHTRELATALGLRIIFDGYVEEAAWLGCRRQLESDAVTRDRDLRAYRGQVAANRAHAIRHRQPEPVPYTSHSRLAEAAEAAITRAGLCAGSPRDLADRTKLCGAPPQIMLDLAHSICRDRHRPAWLRAVAAKLLRYRMGEVLPQEALAADNYSEWARVIHATDQHRVAEAPAQSLRGQNWSEVFPYGAGNSRFALVKIGDWIDCTGTSAMGFGYEWFRQMVTRREGTYEQASCMLLMGDVFDYMAPELHPLIQRLPMGSLRLEHYAEIAKEIHRLVRSSVTLLGRRLDAGQLSVCTYWDCLAGRYLGSGDMEKELADRTSEQKPRVWVSRDGTQSADRFAHEFACEVRALLHQTIADGGEQMRTVTDMVASFDTFLEYRKKWVRPGSVTGSPKADIYLEAVSEREGMIAEVADDIAAMGTYVLANVRLNKAATFEFAEFPAIVKRVLADYVPNSFTRYFIKNEIGKPAGRALYPSHLAHYVAGQFALYALMKAQPIPKVRLASERDVAMDEHWMWMQAREFTVGVMLDYDNFNEKHEFADMQLIMRELKGLYRTAGVLSPDLKTMIDWVAEAYDRTVLEYDGELHSFKHGMLSGQAPTSAINNIINGANKRLLIRQVEELTGRVIFQKRTSGGDDVAGETYSLYDAYLAVKCGQQMGLAFKDIKQLLSSDYYEFFRLFVSVKGVHGSLPRALGSICSGQWSNSVKAKFVDPAAKLSSVTDAAFKIARRAGGNATFREKLCATAFKKWASYNEQALVRGFIHGERHSGGLGVPMSDGSVLRIEPIQWPDEERVRLKGLPKDASQVVVEDAVKQATELVGPDSVESAEVVANRLSEQVFKANVAAMEGSRVGQLLGSWEGPRHVRVHEVLRISEADVAATAPTAEEFRAAYAKHKTIIEYYRKAGAKYDALAGVVKPKAREKLARASCNGTPCDYKKLYFWKEHLTMYGCGTYLLTEDTYDAASMLALVVSSELSNEAVSRRLAECAVALKRAGLVSY